MRPVSLLLLGALALGACSTLASGGVPRRAFLTVVQIDDAPLSNAGEGWDGSLGGGPEVYFRIYPADFNDDQCLGGDVLNPRDDELVVSRFSDEPWVEDVDVYDFPLVWDVDPAGPGFEFLSLDAEYRVAVCDYDPLDADEAIAQTEAFTFGEFAPPSADGRDDVIVLEGRRGGFDTAVRLRVVYGD